ncbi:MAG: excinuclease ABC subunit UvrA [Muribaculaceae bacterium]|nr:excinuclease ABC subunit UvrA [Muribaculaceae bacterium]
MNSNTTDTIIIKGARENNLKDVTLAIPKHAITVFTGVSGSGKSSLVLDTIAAKSRRELNDTFPTFVQQYLPKYGRPHVDAIENLPIAIVIDQKKPAQNSRSTVATYTDVAALLRLLFSRVGQPFVGYAESFSFNHPEGSCPRCSGLGEIRELDIHKLIDFDKSLNDEDTIHYIAFGKGGWRWIRYAHSGLFDLDKKIKDYTPEELDLFLNSPQIRLKNPPANWPKTAKYEGIIPRMYRSIINSEEGLLHSAVLNPMLRMGVCPDCHGTRLSQRVLSCKIDGINIAQACAMSISKLNAWIAGLMQPLAVDLKAAIGARLTALEEIGLGYLSLDRAVGTLSGGEAQRCKIAKYINSSLADVLYILDEPSIGLHDHDIERLRHSVRRLRDAGNTVLLVEHHKQMISLADHIVDMGPGAGSAGGQVIFEGTYDALLHSGTSTGQMLTHQGALNTSPRRATGTHALRGATLHNLKAVDIDLPLGVLAVVAGVAGSGKSSLMESFRIASQQPVVYISQRNIGVSLRSTPATYIDVATDIRKVFARAHKMREQQFTFNGKGGCQVCGGKGVVVAEMAFMDNIETTCEACHGLRYSPETLQYTVRGMNIAQVMDMSVRRATEFFAGTVIEQKLRPLMVVGLEYLHLNQALSTLSGGELQRMKIASYLQPYTAPVDKGGQRAIFIIDEPTDGLHLKDVHHLIDLFNSMVDAGNTVYVVEHNTDVIRAADFVVEMGPGAGELGGNVIFSGTPAELLKSDKSITAQYAR